MTEPHPLFPTENDDDEPIEVGFIHVTRHEAGGQKWAPPLYAANDLGSLEDVTNRYGGGTYELIARSLDKKRITGRRRYSLPGRPLPLDDSPHAQETSGAPAPVVAPQSSSDQLLVAVLNMMQAQQAQNTQLLVAMLTRGEASSKEHIQSMTQLHDRFANGQAELFRAMLEAKGSGGGEGSGGVDTFLKGLEFAQEMQAGIREAQEENGGGDSDLKDLIEGFKTFYAMKMQEEAMKRGAPPPNGAAE